MGPKQGKPTYQVVGVLQLLEGGILFFEDMNKYVQLLSQPQVVHTLREKSVSYLGIFGSAARGEDRLDSDVDVVYRLDKSQKRFTLIDLVAIKDYLEEVAEKLVDIADKDRLKPVLRPYIESDIIEIYAN